MTTPTYERPQRMSLTCRALRWVGAAATVLTLAAAGGLASAAPAQAEPFPFADGFETPGLWVQGEVAGMTEVTIQLDSRARENTNNIAILDAFPRNPAFASVFRNVNPDDITLRPGRTCTPSIYVRRVANDGEPQDFVDLWLRVRKGGPTGPILSTKGLSYKSTTAWTQADFNPFPWPVEPFSIEVSAFLGTVLVDDLNFRCA